MSDLPKRKHIRIEDYDYSTPGAYFITVCTANRERIFWSNSRGELRSPVLIGVNGNDEMNVVGHNAIFIHPHGIIYGIQFPNFVINNDSNIR